VAFTSSTAPFVIRENAVQIGTGLGRMVYLDAFPSSIQSVRMQLEHDDAHASQINWAAAAAAVRGTLQVPATATLNTQVVSEPVTEFEDYSSDGIDKLIAGLRARS
jgi:hypothetical protein